MAAHVDAATAERDSFGFEAEPLFDRRVAPQLDLSSGAEDAMPGEPKGPMQRPGNPSRRPGEARGTRYGAIGRDLPARDPADSAANSGFDGHASRSHPTTLRGTVMVVRSL